LVGTITWAIDGDDTLPLENSTLRVVPHANGLSAVITGLDVSATPVVVTATSSLGGTPASVSVTVVQPWDFVARLRFFPTDPFAAAAETVGFGITTGDNPPPTAFNVVQAPVTFRLFDFAAGGGNCSWRSGNVPPYSHFLNTGGTNREGIIRIQGLTAGEQYRVVATYAAQATRFLRLQAIPGGEMRAGPDGTGESNLTTHRWDFTTAETENLTEIRVSSSPAGGGLRIFEVRVYTLPNGNGGTPPASVTWNISDAAFESLGSSDSTDPLVVRGLTVAAGIQGVNLNANDGDGTNFTRAVSTRRRANATQSHIVVPLTGPGTVTVFATSNGSSATFMDFRATPSATTNLNATTYPLAPWASGMTVEPSIFESETLGAHTVVIWPDASARIMLVRVDYED
jgi:hypothetical protein